MRAIHPLTAALAAAILAAAPAFAQTKPSKDPAVREMKPAECDRNYPDKVACPPKSVPEDRRCANLGRDIAGLSGLTGYVNEQKKTDLRKQYDLMCADDRGSEYECEHLGRDLAGSGGAATGFAAETRKGDLRWIYDRRCAKGGGKKPAVVIVPAVTAPPVGAAR
jgi:hypothetical protein